MITFRVVLLFLCAIGGGVHGIRYTPAVNTASGQVRGQLVNLTTGQIVKQYRGIPFAKAERFKPPQAPTPWNEVKDAVTLGKICPQPVSPGEAAQDLSEDCLNLNVFAPNDTHSSSALPVMVWIHGGAYFLGSNRMYDGSLISALGNVIVVAINYRLGVLGFLSTGKSEIKGNYGMLDQVEGLKWVKKNIQRFGGDPDQVTIFGESAGGSSVALLMLSPLASGLYKNVIIQSGTAAAFWAVSYQSEAEKVARSFGKFIGCNSMEEMASCLRSKSFTDIVNAGSKIVGTVPVGFSPVIDDHFMPEAPLSILEGGKFKKSNIMIGVTNDEGTVMTNAVPGLSLGINVTNGISRPVFEDVIKSAKLVRNQNPPVTEAILYRYTDWSNVNDPSRNRRMYVDMGSDAMFIAPAILSANAFAMKSQNPTFFYHWQHRLAQPFPMYPPVPSWVRAYHGADIFFVFGYVMFASNAHSNDTLFTREVIKRWTNFAKTGNPNLPVSVSVSWPKYTVTTQQYMILKPALEVGSKLRPDYMAFWNVFVPRSINSSMPTGGPLTCGQACNQPGHLQVGFALLVSFIVKRLF